LLPLLHYRPTVWLSGNDGTGEPLLLYSACAQAAEPLSAGAGVDRLFIE